jgi:glycosyltransferase involved in cell wall biosynthesis
MGKVLHILMSDYSVDSRVRNETISLNNIYDVLILCMKSKKQTNDEIRESVKIQRCGLILNSKLLSYFVTYIHMLFKSIFIKIDSVHAHDLNALPLGFFISKLKRVPLIYDSHELWSESLHGNHRIWLLKLAAYFERVIAKRASCIITVSESIKDYLEEYVPHDNVRVIRNVPSYIHNGKFDLFREKYDIAADTPIFLYQGLISEARGVKIILQALMELPTNRIFSFVFLGNGPYKNQLISLVNDSNLSHKVYVADAVSQDVLLKYTSSADIGVHAIDNSCLNHEYCLPNKVFEYVNSGIGLLCPDLKELSSFVNDYSVGDTFKCGDYHDLSTKILAFIDNPMSITEAKNQSLNVRKDLSWSSEESILLDVYREVIGK